MHEEDQPADLQSIPEALAKPGSRYRIGLIWVVPLAAILIAAGLALNAILQRGPDIVLQFSSADGLEANKTKVKFKDVDIGTVTAIALSDDRRSVRISVRMDKQAEPLLVEDSRFWIVRPRVTAGGISGLSTFLSGSYIAVDPGKSQEGRQDFVGLDTPPEVISDTPGRQFLLTAEDLGSIDIGVPVYYRRIPVGRVIGYAMDPNGRNVNVRIFVNAPYDRQVTASSRFWHASGIDVSIDSEGVKMDMQSLTSLIVGGIAFSGPRDAADTPQPEAAAETRFVLYPDRIAALRVPDSVVERYVLIFRESVRGLAVGSMVDFRGLPAGEVSRIDIDLERNDSDMAMAVEINLYPERFTRRLRNKTNAARFLKTSRQVIDSLVARGFRAQLRNGNLITGRRYVALDFFPNAKHSKVDWSKPIPELPTQPGTLDSLQDQLVTVAAALQKTLERTDKLVADLDQKALPELTATLRDARQALNRADAVLASDSPVQIELRDTLHEVGRAATAVRNLADMLERQPEALLTGKKANP